MVHEFSFQPITSMSLFFTFVGAESEAGDTADEISWRNTTTSISSANDVDARLLALGEIVEEGDGEPKFFEVEEALLQAFQREPWRDPTSGEPIELPKYYWNDVLKAYWGDASEVNFRFTTEALERVVSWILPQLERIEEGIPRLLRTQPLKSKRFVPIGPKQLYRIRDSLRDIGKKVLIELGRESEYERLLLLHNHVPPAVAPLKEHCHKLPALLVEVEKYLRSMQEISRGSEYAAYPVLIEIALQYQGLWTRWQHHIWEEFPERGDFRTTYRLLSVAQDYFKKVLKAGEEKPQFKVLSDEFERKQDLVSRLLEALKLAWPEACVESDEE